MRKISDLKKCLCLLLTVVGFGLLGAGCSSDDDQVAEAASDVQVEFVLLDSDDNQATAFSEGDDICFRLSLHNSSDRDMTVNLLDLFGLRPYLEGAGDITSVELGEGFALQLFAVYTSAGDYVGSACSSLPEEDFKIKAGKTLPLSCNWLRIRRSNPQLMNFQENSPLPAGGYYAVVNAKYGEGPLTTYRKDFPVRANGEPSL